MEHRPTEVSSLHRYPVKSMTGEAVARLEVDHRGCVGDRRWSVRTAAGRIGSGKDTRRFAAVPRLLELRATQGEGALVVVTFPDGSTCAVDGDDAPDRISRFLGQPVTLAVETEVSHFDDGPVSVIGTASVDAVGGGRRAVEPARFRPNLVLATDAAFVEESWVGREVEIGTAVLRVDMASPRCVMVDMATAELPARHGTLAAVGRVNDACLGVVASVVVPGTVTVGDAVTVR